jgi:hypothetical protein
MDVLLSYTVHPFGLKKRVATYEHGERRVGVISQKESYFLPPDQRVRRQKVEVWIDSRPESDEDVHTAPHHYFHVRALP